MVASSGNSAKLVRDVENREPTLKTLVPSSCREPLVNEDEVRRGYFGENFCLKRSCDLHVTDMPSKRTGDWTEGPFRYTLASSGGSCTNFRTLGDKLSHRG
jgi:hypothetical protein